jgi:DNA-binding response OmpR family regulator
MPSRVASALDMDAAPIETGPLTLWPAEGQCFVDGQRLELSRREFEVLLCLASCAGHVVARERLHELIWPEAMPRRHRDVDVYVHRLRLKLAETAPAWTFIHTHHKLGYRLWPEHQEVL